MGERRWTVLACACRMQWPDPQAEDDECLTCGKPIERIEVVPRSRLTALDEAVREHDETFAAGEMDDLQVFAANRRLWKARSSIMSHEGGGDG